MDVKFSSHSIYSSELSAAAVKDRATDTTVAKLGIRHLVRTRSHAMFSWKLLVGLVLVLMCPCTTWAAQIGGADMQTSSWLVRSLSGMSEGFRLALKTITPDTLQRPPTKTKLISVGFARTGTTSFVTALKQLGYTPCHDNEVIEVADLLAQRFNDTHPLPVGDFLDEFGARGFDVLFWFSYEIVEWVVQHPEVDIKFVLTYRDSGHKWAASWAAVAHGMDILSSRPFIWIKSWHGILKAYKHLLWNIQTQGRPQLRTDVDALEESYYKHIQRVRAMIPPDKLLEFNMKEGWTPLCEFLGKPVPDTQFPHVNDRVVMQALLGTLRLITWIWPVVPLLLGYCVLVVLRRFGLIPSGPHEDKKRQ